jgi:hypothetical protein
VGQRERTVLVRCYENGVMEVALRDEPGGVWGPPIRVEVE